MWYAYYGSYAMAVRLSDEEANEVAKFLGWYASRIDAPWGPDERRANELAGEIQGRINE